MISDLVDRKHIVGSHAKACDVWTLTLDWHMIAVQTIRLFHSDGFGMDIGVSTAASKNAVDLHGPDSKHRPSLSNHPRRPS